MTLSTNLFDYHLPKEAIAQTPAERRDGSRLMVVCRKSRKVEHRVFAEITQVVRERTVFFRNNARVIKARVYLQRASGAEVELLLLRPSTDAHIWWCLARPLKKIKEGETLQAADGTKVATLRGRSESGEALFEFLGDPLQLSERYGKLPLPPYIHRDKQDARDCSDTERYQTVYAKPMVAAAAPTAGLHFTPELIKKLEADGHEFVDVTLHVGLDTFRPIATDSVEAHQIHTEHYSLSTEAQAALKNPQGRKRLAVGTTSLRTIEDYTRKGMREASAEANLYIYPPNEITAADMLLTNFHLPKSTLMCLVSSFLTPNSTEGIAWLKELYAEALREGYRFYSYGDAMVII